jgi:ribonuclease G
MSEEVLINISPMETRVALVENGVLQEVRIERERSRGIVGNIYVGRVVRVLPGMQAAFVDIGLERSAFIHVSELTPRDRLPPEEEQPLAREEADMPSIDTLVKEGDSLVVQVTKDPIGSKGARLTTNLSFASRYLVLMPSSSKVGVSLRLEDTAERNRLRSLVEGILDEDEITGFGFILRTAAEGVEKEDLRSDLLFLTKLWKEVKESIHAVSVPAMVHEDLPLYKRVFRDMVHEDIERIRIDSHEKYEESLRFSRRLLPEMENRLELYEGNRPLFDLYSVEDEIEKALGRKVDLKSGGHIIIDQTEAMTTIDVNTGGFIGHRNFEETIFKTNLEAANAIGRQIRLRNLGGIIIIDFIDMKDEEHRALLLKTFSRAIEKDHSRTRITGVSELGLVEMSRKRTRESLENTLCERCMVCHGRGTLKTSETVCYQIFRDIIRNARDFEAEGLMVMASQSIVDRLLDEESDYVADLERYIGRPIRFQVESSYMVEDYDVVLM